MTRAGMAGGIAALVLLVSPAVAPAVDVCGDADGNGTVTVSDGVQTLRAAASLASSCTPARCDMDDSGDVTVSDGVKVLRAAAALPVVPACPHVAPTCASLTATITLATPEPVGAAKLTVMYPTAAVTIPGINDAVTERITVLTTASIIEEGAFKDDDQRVIFNIVTLDGVESGPLFTVRFDCLAAAPAASAFACGLDTVVTTDGVTAIEGATCTVDVTAE